MTSNPHSVFIVPHTHWDREWYLSAHRFGVRLEHVVSEVLERLERPDDLPHFLFDGQAILLADYLDVHPEDAERIRTHVRSRRLAIGPWYVLQDEFLVSGESTVRNLLVGDTLCSALGGKQPVGYVPDAFGHVAQLPQILRGAGIDNFVFTRGMGDELATVGSEFHWEAPDGSKVLAIKQVGGYCNAGALGFGSDREVFLPYPPDPEKAVRQVEILFDRLRPLARQSTWILNVGCDHLPPQRDLAQILDKLQETYPRIRFEVGTLAAAIESVRKQADQLTTFTGELRGAATEHLLPGVLSSRMPLKQANEQCEQYLAGTLEPLATTLHFAARASYPKHSIDALWKLLLANHPHDSICGCSIDSVHREMQTRFTGLRDAAEETILRLLRGVVSDPDAADVAVFNALPFARRTVIERTVVLPPETDTARLELVDDDGDVVSFAVLRTHRLKRFWGPPWQDLLSGEQQRGALDKYRESYPDWFGGSEPDHDLLATVQFEADLPSLGISSFALRERGAGSEPSHVPDSLVVGDAAVDNGLVRVELRADGRLSVEEKSTGTRYEGLNRLVDTEDAGDEYDYSPARASHAISASGIHGAVKVLEDSGFRATLEASFTWNLPASLTPDRSQRSDELIGCPVVVRATVERGSPLVRMTLHFDNCVSDHRLRVLFPTDIHAPSITSDGVFHIDRRPVEIVEHSGWVHPPPETYPQREFTLVEDGSRGLAVLNRGLPEVAPYRQRDGGVGIALTLLRSVGWLSRDDLATRPGAIGPILPTPDAQCLGKQRFEYALFCYAGSATEVDIKRVSANYRAEPVTVQGAVDIERPLLRDLVELVPTPDRPNAALSALKRHRDRDTLIVRVYNWTTEEMHQCIQFGRAVSGAWFVDLMEERQSDITLDGQRSMTISMRPHKIVTLEVDFQN